MLDFDSLLDFGIVIDGPHFDFLLVGAGDEYVGASFVPVETDHAILTLNA